MDPNPLTEEPGKAIEAAAIRWLVRRDRGLSAAEASEFQAWREADSRHAAAVAHIGAMWSSLDRLQALSARTGGAVDPNLLARRAGRRTWRIPAGIAALAAVLALAWTLGRPGLQTFDPRPPQLARGVGEVLRTLSDGSVVALQPGAQIEERYTPAERRVTLTRGEAIFTVTKNPFRPFLVSAGGVRVRAVGTVFAVRLESRLVHVVVTEGKVWGTPAGGEGLAGSTAETGGRLIAAGESADFPFGDDLPGSTLVFAAQPLADVVAQFNRHNRVQLVVGDAATGSLRIGGTFRADNVAGFLRLIDASFGVKAQAVGNEQIVLRRSGAAPRK